MVSDKGEVYNLLEGMLIFPDPGRDIFSGLVDATEKRSVTETFWNFERRLSDWAKEMERNN